MPLTATQITINLANCTNEREVLIVIGQCLNFRGLLGIDETAEANTDPELRDSQEDEEEEKDFEKYGWGVNWDAFHDCLACVKGCNKLCFENWQAFKDKEPDDFQIFTEILTGSGLQYVLK